MQVLVLTGWQTVPLELWHSIFTLACTDGGFTGASLARVSRFFHAASLPVRLHSLVFTSLQQAESFLMFVEAQRGLFASHGGPAIHHLLLKSWEIPFIYLARSEVTLLRGRFVGAVTQLLQVAAPHLRSLSVLQSRYMRFPAVKCCFERLEELTLLITDTLFLNPRTTPEALFPSLNRLHIISGEMTALSMPPKFQMLPVLAPALSHLRISDAGNLNSLPHLLRDAMGIPAPVDESLSPRVIRPPDTTVRPSYPSVQHIIVHTRESTHTAYPALKADLRAIEEACRQQVDGVQLVAYEGRRHPMIYWPKRVEKDWFERMDGGRGCWTLQQSDGDQDGVGHYNDSDDDVW